MDVGSKLWQFYFIQIGIGRGVEKKRKKEEKREREGKKVGGGSGGKEENFRQKGVK